MTALILDITRTIMRAAHASPTGIDRVERAYLEWALSQHDRKVAFICRIRGGQTVLSRRMGEKIFRETAFRPSAEGGFEETRRQRRLRTIRNHLRTYWRSRLWFRSAMRGTLGLRSLGIDPRDALYLNVSHNNIERESLGLFRRMGMKKIVVFIHDVIPADYPEYVNGLGVERFVRKLASVAKHADALVFNSAYTGECTMRRITPLTGIAPKTMIGHLGINEIWDADQVEPAPSEAPYFVMLGTIEPRKNHLLMLQIWRRLEEQMDNPPHLRIIGWRGWENENILDFLDRSPMMNRTVFEHPGDSDETVRMWIKGARAVLYPTFVEGFGMPVVEAMASGTPVICSDLPVLREIGGEMPDYIDPLDGTGWMERILAYTPNDSHERAAQLARLKSYTPPDWDTHFQKLARFLDDLDASS
ncbi:MAG: glycosyltransferase family 4 protein [Neomegalonema sp.]|nr:glycosyltransferase family 4 protein [Neomegalonema sp.]